MIKPPIDWNAVEAKAEGMTRTAIRYAIEDILATLDHADAMDRSDSGNRGGYYRDELSIYRKVLRNKR